MGWTSQLAEIKVELSAIQNDEISGGTGYDSQRIKAELFVIVLGEETRSLVKLKSRYSTVYRCNKKLPCFIKKLKLETTRKEQAVMFYFDSHSSRSYRLNAEVYENEGLWGWRKKQEFHAYPDSFGDKKKKDIIKALEQGKFKLIQPAYFDFEVEGIELRQ